MSNDSYLSKKSGQIGIYIFGKIVRRHGTNDTSDNSTK